MLLDFGDDSSKSISLEVNKAFSTISNLGLPLLNIIPSFNKIVIIFENSEKSISVVKRVLGLPGETVSASDGKLKINGNAINDSWAKTVTDDFIDCKVNELSKDTLLPDLTRSL